MPRKKAPEPRTDRSATARLVHDFGLLLIKAEFERYLDEKSLYAEAFREGRLNEHVPLDEQHMLRFVPLLELLGNEELGRNSHSHHFEEIERLQQIEAFLQAYKLTVDFSLQVSELRKRLKRKFEKKPTALTLPYRSKNLISNDLVKHCRDVMWIIEDFNIEIDEDNIGDNQDDIDEILWDVNIWTVILDADRLHREQGRVHSAFVNYLNQYQDRKGSGSPRVYLRTALTVLLAECFEDFDQKKRRPRISDRSENADKDQYGNKNEGRKAYYDSAFARFLIKFVSITNIIDPVPQHAGNSLDHFKTIADLRLTNATPRLSDRLNQSLKGREVSEIIEILDTLKF